MSGRLVVVDADPSWPRRFEEERLLIERACEPGSFVAIEHVGSTSVPGLDAKPIIDLMPGVASIDEAFAVIPELSAIGYVYMPEHERVLSERRYFRKDVAGARAFHMHLVEVGGRFWLDQLLFRDYLRQNPDVTKAYARLKRDLEGRCTDAPSAYLDGKSEFVAAVLRHARVER